MAALFAMIAAQVAAQIPNTLLHSIPPPYGSHQSGAELGRSVAVDGELVVMGTPLHDTGAAFNSGAAKVFNASTGALLYTLVNPTVGSQDFFGFSVAVSGTRVVVGAYNDSTGVYQSGSVYVYDLAGSAPTVPVVVINNPARRSGDHFGFSVAISGTRIVTGAFADDTGANNAGSVYVYDLSSATPALPLVTMNNPDPAYEEHFGSSVAISGTKVVIGAAGDDTGAINAGSAYVYDLGSPAPTIPVVTLRNPSPGVDDGFGAEVGISGARVIVGAGGDNTGASDAGSVYVYDLGNGTPAVPVLTLNHPAPVATGNFGSAAAISGTRLVVGALYNDARPNIARSVYVYDLGGGNPVVPVVTLMNPGSSVQDFYGHAVAISGVKVAVGAYWDDRLAVDAGTGYVYDLSSATPAVPTIMRDDPGPSSEDNFGYAVAVSGTRVVVGAWADDRGGTNSGSVYVYDLSSSSPTVPVFTLNNPEPAAYDVFGWSVAIDGPRIVVGAWGNDSGGATSGSAYVYDLGSAFPATPIAVLNNPEPASYNVFGRSVAISGARVVVGASSDDTGATDAVSAYVYDLNSGPPAALIVELNNPSTSAGGFGGAVAISGQQVVVGGYVYDFASAMPSIPKHTLDHPGRSVAISGNRVVVGNAYGSSGAGNAYVYDLSGGTPGVAVITLNNPSPVTDDYFGASVAISGTRVVVGATDDNTGGSNSGSAYVYDLSGVTPLVPIATLNNPSPAVDDRFGSSVAIDGTTVVVGTPDDDSVIRNKGHAYIYGPHPLDQDSDGLRDVWELTYWPATAGHSAGDDFDHDGYSELLELALGLDPRVANPGGLPAVVIEGGFLTMRLTKRPGVAYEVQSAGSPLPARPNSFSAASTTVLVNNATTLHVRDNFPVGAQPGRFLRLKVTAAP